MRASLCRRAAVALAFLAAGAACSRPAPPLPRPFVEGAQAREVADDAKSVNGPVFAGGDLNSFFFMADIANGSTVDAATQVFIRSGYTDARAGLPLDERYTAHMLRDVVLDLIFVRGAAVVGHGILSG